MRRSLGFAATGTLLLTAGASLLVGFSSQRGRNVPESEILARYPGYSEFQRVMSDPKLRFPDFSALLTGRWDAERKEWAFHRVNGESWKRFDGKALVDRPDYTPPAAGAQRAEPGRGRQRDQISSPDGKWKAIYKDRNVQLVGTDGTTTPVTTDGSVEKRIKFGTASWVYGEELEQRDAMWFSPDSKKLAYYRFDESKVPDYYVTLGEGDIVNRLMTEAYPKAGAPNPVVDLFVYDLATKKTTQVDVRFPTTDTDPVNGLGHYVYSISWKDDGTLFYSRMNRLQNRMEMCIADASTGKSKVIFAESNPDGWVDYKASTFYANYETDLQGIDKDHALWITERNGYRNFVSIDLTGRTEPKVLTKYDYEVRQVEYVDSKRGEIWYSARSVKDHPYWVQLHRMKMDGTGDVRLTTPNSGHAFQIAPDGTSFIDTADSLTMPSRRSLRDRNGKELVSLGDGKQPIALGAQPFSCLAADGKTTIYGWVKTPKGTGPHPLILEVYGGPESGTSDDRYSGPDPRTEFGFAIAWVDGRGTQGRGRAFRQSGYKRLGTVDIDDQAAFVKALIAKGLVQSGHVGITGTSYGGYASAMAILRYPDVFNAAVSCSPVTDWRNYDSIYTERYMALPEGNAEGYKNGSAMTYAENLKGKLMLYYGTADDNVHPSNTFQLTRALDKAKRRYDLKVGVDQGHSAVDGMIELEFLAQALLPNPRP